MEKLVRLLDGIDKRLIYARSVGILGLRLVLAYGFLIAAQNHWSQMEGTIYYFASLGIPFPTLNAYLAVGTEFLGAILLTLGLGVRYISIPLIFTMIVAIITVHWGHGYTAFENIPDGSFLFQGDVNLGSSAGVEIYNAGAKVGDVSVYATYGMEIPVMYICMLLVLIGYGAGRFSLDKLLKRA